MHCTTVHYLDLTDYHLSYVKRSTCAFLTPAKTARHAQKELEEDTNVLVLLATKASLVKVY